MTQVTHPPHQLVREYMQRRRQQRTPPPAPDEIRRQLGWGLIEGERESLKLTNRGNP